MNENDLNETDDTHDPGQAGVTEQGKDKPLIVRGLDRRRKESGVFQEEAAMPSREK